VRYLAHARQLSALDRISELGEEFAEAFGRDSGGLVRPYRSADADVVVVAMGSVLGTIKDVVDALRDRGHRIGALGITSFRPFPVDAVRAALAAAQRVVVVEKAFSVGFGGVLSTDVALALSGLPSSVATVVAGLGGRPIPASSLERVFAAALAGSLDRLTFLDLNSGLVENELERMAAGRRSGPTAENLLRDLGAVGSRIG
jgi:pyruvate ferredoxin oxidoreductase alpha subunit